MIAPNWRPGQQQLRQFAVACLPGFALIGYAVHRWTGSLDLLVLAVVVGGVCCLVGLMRPGIVWPLYAVLTAITLPIGWLASELFLRVLFYGVLTPLGVLFKLLRRDPLLLKRPQTETYWIERRQQEDPVTYYRQS